MAADLIDEARRRRFEQRRRADSSARIEDDLPPPDDPGFLPTLEELVLIDLEFGWKETTVPHAGPLVEDYLARFPALGERAVGLRLLRAEYEIRLARGNAPSLDDYRRRFPAWLVSGLEFFEAGATASQSSSDTSDVALAAEESVSSPTKAEPPPDPVTVWNIASRGVDPQGKSDLAQALAAQGKLTDFQARRLLAGAGASLLLGEYVLLDEIGAGGMGCVYKAEHRRMKRIVALKTIAPAALRDAQAVRRFQREVHAAARLEHPNIVTAHDAGQAGDVHFLVMQFVEGVNLSTLVKAEGPLPIDKALDYVLQAARGLAFAHGEGIVHRDVKPANLLLDKKGVVKILDLGLARIDASLEGITSTEQMMGTIDYMSPEQASNAKAADSKSDVYSLGCTLWYLLTGRRMYDGDTAFQRVLAHREHPIPSLAAARGDVPPALDALHAHLVAKRPDDRPTMAELVVELEQFAEPSSAGRETSRWTTPAPPRQTTRYVAAACLAIAAALGIARMMRSDDEHHAPPAVELASAGGATNSRPEAAVKDRLAEIDLLLGQFAGLDQDVAAVDELEKKYLAAKDVYFGNEPHQVATAAVKLLSRLRTYPLTDEERALVAKADARTDKFTFYPEEVFIPIRQLADMLAARKRQLEAERMLLLRK